MAAVLCVAVHPDDETLGCGATLLQHRRRGDTLHWLVVTAIPDADSQGVARQQGQLDQVGRAFAFDSVDWLRLPTTELEQQPLESLIRSIRDVVARVRPEILYVPNRSDVHSDHRVVARAVQAVVKSFYMKGLGVRRVLACEVPSETDAAMPLAENAFLPNVFVDVTDTLERKLEIMSLYPTEVHPEPLPRSLSSIRALARHRGAAIGVEYAEAFMLLREVVA